MLNTTNGDAERFIFAGNATITVSNPQGERYTFKVRAKDARDAVDLPRTYFASLLTGPDNTADYSYIGIVRAASGFSERTNENYTRGDVILTRKSRYTAESTPVRVLAWILRLAVDGRALPAGYALRHEGRCGRCGRKLTVPESIDAGIGPECATRL